MEGSALSKYIREKKKKAGQANLRADMDYAGQDGVDPNDAWDEKQDMEINEAMNEEPEKSASASMMGEGESTQKLSDRKKISARIGKYMDEIFYKAR